MLVSYNWLKEYLGPDAPSAKKIVDLFTDYAFEVDKLEAKGDDWLIDVDILPSRSSDCLSHRGIAREIATLTDKPLAFDPFAKVPDLTPSDLLAVEIEDGNDCPRSCLLYTSPSPRDRTRSRMPSSA